MKNNINKYKTDLIKLINLGEKLLPSMIEGIDPNLLERYLEKYSKEKAEEIKKNLPSFDEDYQAWYSEAKALIKQFLPDRYMDFVRFYEKPKSRKDITIENYTIEDYFQLLTVKMGEKTIVDPVAALPLFKQQLAILKSVQRVFESSLYSIKNLMMADLFDSELDAAKELLNHRFYRSAGALCGVVLEHHLKQICGNHNIDVKKNNPNISDLNKLLKENRVIDIAQWRFIQYLTDIRNLCDHAKETEPTEAQINDLLEGVNKITKTIF